MATIAAAAVAGLGAVPTVAAAAQPIPEGPSHNPPKTFIGRKATSHPVSWQAAPKPPRHPFMAPNDDSNIHDDAYQTDTANRPGPLGRHMNRRSTFQLAECATVTFDRRRRVETLCVGLDRLRLLLLHPRTLRTRAEFDIPPRRLGGADPFTDFSGGGYFYLDDQDRAIIPVNLQNGNTELWVVAQAHDGHAFKLQRVYDLTPFVPPDDKLIAVMPDWDGLYWLVSRKGRVLTVQRRSGNVHVRDTKEPIGNSFAVDETGGVYIVTDKALYRFDANRHSKPQVTWREKYKNIGKVKPGQTEAGSGTTPTLMGKRYVAITDNAEHMHVVVFRRRRHIRGSRKVCEQAVFKKGESATDNSLIATRRAMVVENNYGYKGPSSTENGKSVPGGLERVDINADGDGCHKAWHNNVRAPSVVAKLSLRNGLVYTYHKPKESSSGNSHSEDPWYLTAIDFRTGHTIYKRLAGRGLGYNNNYAPITLGPTGTAYIGVLGGLVAMRDPRRPPSPSRSG